MNIVYNHDMVISMLIETSLLFKTIVILSMQLGLVLFSCFYFLRKAKEAYQKNTTLLGLSFRGSVNMKGKLDLIPFVKQKDTFPKRMSMYVDKNNTLIKEAKNQDEVIKFMKEGYSHDPEGGGPLVSLMIFWMIALYTTAAVTSFYLLSLWQTMFLFSLTSISFGPLLAVVMLEMDENDGFTALKIVLMVTILTGFIGYSDFYSFSENTIFGGVLLLCLFALLLFNFARFFMEFSRQTTRLAAIAGATLFSFFLIYDFNYIKNQSSLFDRNDWNTAVEMAFILYLDIINLLLEILEAMGNSQ
ncbi:MAG: Bax inhibitor-1 family protein [Gammaproteobacteria bacterium]|tara:strand:- start:49 stop:954 length:906 start_codon:yes stop_codon:yes gene_type:complete